MHELWGNIRETEDGQTTNRTSLLYGKIFSHRYGTGMEKKIKFGIILIIILNKETS